MKKLETVRRLVLYLTSMIGVFIISFLISQRANASSTWYSDSYNVGYWSTTAYVQGINTSSSFSVMSYMTEAVKKWRNAGIDCYVSTSPSMAQISFYGGTKAQLKLVGFSYTSDINGLTVRKSYSKTLEEGSYSYYEQKEVIASMCSDYVYNESYFGVKRTATEIYNHIALHEIGHALGWYGHIGDGSAVMFGITNGINTLTSSDINQLLNAYIVIEE